MSQSLSLPPDRRTAIPGPASRSLAGRLAAVECRNVTCLEPVPPIFWERASGANVWDVDGNRYVDLTAAFAVANCGHSHPRVTAAVADQADRLLHGMGDVHPSAVKVQLLEALVKRFPGGGSAGAVLSSSGSDAVETAIKTAQLVTGRSGLIAFEGGYHGLSFGALDATARPMFSEPFAGRLPAATTTARFGDLASVEAAGDADPPGAVLVEPIQGRGGNRIPPDGFLAGLRKLCDREGWLLICDEIFTGFGRTGSWFACNREGVVPDLLCVGKGLASGMPISACIGRAAVMDAWPPSQGEALHTQTFLGHPPGCAAALAALAVIEEEQLVEASARNGAFALGRLRERLGDHPDVVDLRGRGLLIAVEFASKAVAERACRGALERGFITLLSGDDGAVLSLTPPLCIEAESLALAVDAIAEAVA